MEKNINSRYVKTLKILLVIFVCGIALSYCLYCSENFGKYSEYYGPDEGHYIEMAKRIINEKTYGYWGEESDAYVSPGYPMFLVMCMKIFGQGVQGIHYIKIVQGVLFSLTVLLVYYLAQLLFKSYFIGIVASFLIAINGAYAYYSHCLLTETLYYFTMMVFAVVFVAANQKDKKRWHFLAGITFAITIMVRPLILIITPVMYIPLILKEWGHWKKILQTISCFVIGFVLICMPWWIRNIVVMDELILLATQTNPIYAGLAPDITALGIEDPGSMSGNIKLLIQLLLEHPLKTIYWMTIGKFEIFFLQPGYSTNLRAVTDMIVDIVVYFGFAGSIIMLWDKRKRWISIIFLTYLAGSFLFIPTQRYSLQYLPFLSIFACFLIVRIFACKKCK